MMRSIAVSLSRAALAGVLSLPFAAEAQQRCAALGSLEIPDVTLTEATEHAPPWRVPRQSGFLATAEDLTVTAPVCRIVGHANPAEGSHIGFEVWLPTPENWNGRFLAAGNPGFIGSIARGALANIVQRGYVAASTDTGHVDEGYEWAIGQPERWVDWGHRAVHVTAVVAKQLAERYYGSPVRYAYWNSCHNGGNQGLNEAQRYPDDFDGIVASDPAYHVSHLQSASLYLSWLSLKDGVDAPGYIPPAKYPVLHRAALDACDADDGLVDGIIGDPATCGFDPASIRCHGPDRASCLTDAQVEAARAVYAGARFADGTPIYGGLERGSELGWQLLLGGPEPFWVNYGYFKGMVFEDPEWDFRSFDLERDTRLAAEKTGFAVDAADPDLRPFRDAGGKLVLVQAWNETGVPPRTLIDYYRNVEQVIGDAEETRDFARLFMVPGSSGCPGFRNPEDFDTQTAIERWVEQGIAPEQIVYAERDQGRIYRRRPVCPYPEVARHQGGDPNAAESFRCAEP